MASRGRLSISHGTDVLTRESLAGVLPQSFFARDALVVAEALIGKLLRRDDVLLRITEVEAYRHPNDSASHCRMGRTPRNEPMWGPPGHTYVYLCYGMHRMLNIVTNTAGEGAAVLVRSCEVVEGADTVALRRNGLRGPSALAGPGKVGAALALETSHSRLPLFGPGGLCLLDAPPVSAVLVGPRVGIDFATPADRRAPWRIASADSRAVTQLKSLRRKRSR